MKALTLWQPWATLIVNEMKPFEFRRWPAPKWIWDQRIGIHAGARPVRPTEIDDLIEAMRHKEGWGTALKPEALGLLIDLRVRPEQIPLSSMLGTAIIGKPVPAAEAVRQAYGEDFKGDSDRFDHQVFGWPILDVRRFDVPVPVKGAQGFWNWEEAVAP